MIRDRKKEETDSDLDLALAKKHQANYRGF